VSGYVALPRGVETGDVTVSADSLRKILAYIGFKKIRVMADGSGAAFEAVDNNRRKMEAEIAFELRHAPGVDQGIILLTVEELRAITAAHPLADRGDEGNLYVTVLSHDPAREDVDMLVETMNGLDEHAVVGKAVYSYYGAGYQSSRRSNEFFEKVMKLQATTRSWAAMRKLLELSSDESGQRFIPDL